MKFETWLKKQKKRQDPIGDLSRDFISTKDTVFDLLHLYKYHTTSLVIDAYKEAYSEYFIFLSNNLVESLREVNDFSPDFEFNWKEVSKKCIEMAKKIRLAKKEENF